MNWAHACHCSWNVCAMRLHALLLLRYRFLCLIFLLRLIWWLCFICHASLNLHCVRTTLNIVTIMHVNSLKNGVCRTIFWQAFATIAESPLKIDLSSVLEQVVTELTTFLRKVCIFISLSVLDSIQGSVSVWLVWYSLKTMRVDWDKSILVEVCYCVGFFE